MQKKIAIDFNGKQCQSVKFKCKSGTNTRHILDKLDLVDFPFIQSEADTLKYLILELLTNSLRATDEIRGGLPIVIDMQINKDFFIVTIEDGAGGFDVKLLPYNIDEEPSHIDILSRDFIEYRERHGFERFGMGIYSVKVWSDVFKLGFIDEDGKCIKYTGRGSVAGTRIVFKKQLSKLLKNAS